MTNVSAVIPTRNRSAQLKDAIDSVLRQSLPVREVIVVDDGSTDETGQILASYGDRIRAISQPQGGASAARNRGFREARGEWIAFLDDDDVWLETKNAKQMALAQNNPSLGLIYCGDIVMDERLRKVLKERPAIAANRGDVFERLVASNFIFTSGVIAKREAINQAGHMDVQLRWAHDWDLWLKIVARYTVDVIPEPLVLYRLAADGLTYEIRATERIKEMETVVKRACDLREVPGSVMRTARYELDRQWASSFLKEGKGARAFRHALRMATIQPTSSEAYRFLRNAIVPKQVRAWAKRLLIH